jgi:Uri superfamily endonuclease
MPPERAGTYVLILQLPRRATIAVGRLGRFRFPAGWYAYAGSARGPGGLVARISRHRRSSKPRHWHVDYLRAYARPVAVWYAIGDQKRECAWAEALSRLPGASVPAPRFGASDCRCPTHLLYFDAPPDRASFARAVDEAVLEERFDV